KSPNATASPLASSRRSADVAPRWTTAPDAASITSNSPSSQNTAFFSLPAGYPIWLTAMRRAFCTSVPSLELVECFAGTCRLAHARPLLAPLYETGRLEHKEKGTVSSVCENVRLTVL